MSAIYGNRTLSIERLLLQWQKVLAKATARMKPYPDLPYWYNERANVGYVAQAASALGWAVLEEYTVDRGKGKQKAPGRADLWTGDSSGDEHESEFKLYWPSIKSTDKTLAENIEGYLDKAKFQLDQIKNKPGRRPHKVAMVFVCPSIARNGQRRWKNLLVRFENRVAQPRVYRSEFSAVFAPPSHIPWQNRVGDDGYLYPAIAVFGKMV